MCLGLGACARVALATGWRVVLGVGFVAAFAVLGALSSIFCMLLFGAPIR